MEDRKYTEKYVAFIDILGFSAMLKEDGDNASRISRLFNEIVTCKKISPRINRLTNIKEPLRTMAEVHASPRPNDDYTQCYDAALGDMIIKIVSDSIILAVPVHDDFGFTAIVDACSYIARHLLHFEKGYFVRGAITRGNVYLEEENVFFGEAYTQAYKLEAHSSIYPRIIYENNYEMFPYMDSFGRTQTIVDEDGWGDIDYIGNFLGTRDAVWLKDSEERLQSIINSEIQKNNDNLDVCAKYHWVKSQIERAREYVKSKVNA